MSLDAWIRYNDYRHLDDSYYLPRKERVLDPFNCLYVALAEELPENERYWNYEKWHKYEKNELQTPETVYYSKKAREVHYRDKHKTKEELYAFKLNKMTKFEQWFHYLVDEENKRYEREMK
jgi:hypothetical protein